MTNPHPPGSLPALDHALWQRGRDAGGTERDFARALFEPATLAQLRDAVATHAARPGYAVRVAGVRVDANPLVCEPLPKPNPKRELADLAIVVTRVDRGAVRRRMWLLQAKVAAPTWRAGFDTAKEIELYEKRPDFELLGATHPTARSFGRFSVAKEFAGAAPDAIPLWCWILFAEAQPDGSPAAQPPVRVQWPSHPAQAQASFADGVVRSVKGIGLAMGHGADVEHGTPHAEWRRLFLALWRNGTWRTPHYATAGAHDDVTTTSGVRFSRTAFSTPVAPEDLERFRRLASADDDVLLAEPATPPTGFDGPADGPRIPMLLVDVVACTGTR